MSLNYFLSWLRLRLTSESQTAVAQHFAVTPSQVGHWLSGRRIPSASILTLAEYVARYEPVGSQEDTRTCELEQ